MCRKSLARRKIKHRRLRSRLSLRFVSRHYTYGLTLESPIAVVRNVDNDGYGDEITNEKNSRRRGKSNDSQ